MALALPRQHTSLLQCQRVWPSPVHRMSLQYESRSSTSARTFSMLKAAAEDPSSSLGSCLSNACNAQ